MKPLQVYLDETDLKKLKHLAVNTDTNVSAMIRAIVKTYLSKRPKYD